MHPELAIKRHETQGAIHLSRGNGMVVALADRRLDGRAKPLLPEVRDESLGGAIRSRALLSGIKADNYCFTLPDGLPNAPSFRVTALQTSASHADTLQAHRGYTLRGLGSYTHQGRWRQAPEYLA
jgi:hypothetical protein